MKIYVCGFLFSADRERVLLIRKRRPVWQAGRLNGVGGKVEPGETPGEAMEREFWEEAGMRGIEWQECVMLEGSPTEADPAGWRGHFFRGIGDVDSAKATTDEELEIHAVQALPAAVIPNLKWMIPLMLDDEVSHSRMYRVLVAPKR